MSDKKYGGFYRKIYPALLTGKRYNRLSKSAALLFWHITVLADDFGCFHADADLLLNLAYPRRDDTSTEDIEKELMELADNDLILLYEANNEQLGQIVGFTDMQAAGKNGKRISRHELPPAGVNPRKSKKIQENPSESKINLEIQTQQHRTAQNSTEQQQHIPENPKPSQPANEPTPTPAAPAPPAPPQFAAAGGRDLKAEDAHEPPAQPITSPVLTALLDVGIAPAKAKDLAAKPWISVEVVKRRRQGLREGQGTGILITQLEFDERQLWQKAEDQRRQAEQARQAQERQKVEAAQNLNAQAHQQAEEDDALLSTATPDEVAWAVKGFSAMDRHKCQAAAKDAANVPLDRILRHMIARDIRAKRERDRNRPA